ncbi:uncharacterized protein BDV14DRAFT_211828 [Aspergillus stella-maris]|uniref:uncharacterized protein n=1 Tax=Aspergillus stella-maris TaxID=1810926 RepID=UPI003CCD08EA
MYPLYVHRVIRRGFDTMAFEMLASVFGSLTNLFSTQKPSSLPEDEQAQDSEALTFDHDHKSALSLTNNATETNPPLLALKNLVETDGAGTWPPRATHGYTWPEALQLYHEIYLAAAPYLSTEDVSTDDEINRSRVQSFRDRIRLVLKEKIDLHAVQTILASTETNNHTDEGGFDAAAYNGFACCISNLRHAYRWGLIPVVRVAQDEKIIDFPDELVLPWGYISRRFGTTSQGGNLMTNYLCNFDEGGEMIYQVNPGLREEVRRAEYEFAFMLVRIERVAIPIYTEITHAITHYSTGNKPACLSSLTRITILFPTPLQIFYKTLVDNIISPEVWMHYIQGPTGWGAGEMVNGEYVEYDGLSGSHVPLFRVVDAFLGIGAYFDEGKEGLYIPRSQRKFCERVREGCFCQRAEENGDTEIGRVLEGIVRQLKTFRAAHRSRIHKYLSAPAPERLIMTAGKSVLESEEIPEIETAIKHLDGILAKRISETK